SGPNAFQIAGKIFHNNKKFTDIFLKTHTIHHGYIRSPVTGKNIDEVLLLIMRAPNTYTFEDTVEISCHGGIMPLKGILDLCIQCGARLADPGEFTKRAFLNGRLDLTQAEAVIDLIQSKTDAARHVAVEQLRGSFSEEIGHLRSYILDVLSLIEAGIDFSDEDIKFASIRDILEKVEDVYACVKKMIKTADKGIILREGVSVVICGKPNVGKSSLMNALLKHDRVIVTSIAGTTRDIVEESIDLAGVNMRISDTAGIIDTEDRVEIEGIRRSKEKLKNADIVIFVLDSSESLTEKDLNVYAAMKEKRTVLVLNKSDLPKKIRKKEIRDKFGIEKFVTVSALKKIGLEKLEDQLIDKLFDGDVAVSEGVMVTNLRHKNILEKVAENLDRAVRLTDENYNGELLASDLNETVYQLGLIIGESVEDDMLDRIFSRFCVGK
ncbi:MAG: tRNA uridine-5-carboxymethylaminomethyl(34) synthesis GTPase MnmE, partial [Candidatus Omnitrophica bacterium]|nr:tRNA uridine-5-carboxymethylaminomethyl(34) synthesis GTPase MnmE [Candidatus Omnitrophota bacterium]